MSSGNVAGSYLPPKIQKMAVLVRTLVFKSGPLKSSLPWNLTLVTATLGPSLMSNTTSRSWREPPTANSTVAKAQPLSR